MSDGPRRRAWRGRRGRAALVAGAAVLGLFAWTSLPDSFTSGDRDGATARRVPEAASSTTSTEPPTTTSATSASTTTAAPTTTSAAPPPMAAVVKRPASTTTTLPLDPRERLEVMVAQTLNGSNACLIVDEEGSEVLSRGGDDPLAPASTQKLLIAAAALARLGPGFRFETTVVSKGPPVDGTVERLWLVGDGDPLLATPELSADFGDEPRWLGTPFTPLAALADQLVAAGVRRVAAGLSGDDSRYQTPRSLPHWKPEHVASGTGGPLGALVVDRGLESWTPRRQVAKDPAAHASSQLARLLVGRQVEVSGQANQLAPEDAVVLARLTSAPLSEIVAAMLRTSDNLTAELLVLELDRQSGGGGDTAGGLAVVARDAAGMGVPVGGLRMLDGSGLAAANRSTCRALLATLALSSRSDLEAIDEGLAVAGRSGTMIKRLVGTPFEGHLAGKTGWISGAIGFVGRLDVGRPLRFAFLANGSFDFGTARRLEDRVLAELATYSTRP
ncbi:MAG: D-alanyl-D-alanine carboxypeptidase [Acidimicrobiia bacterium]